MVPKEEIASYRAQLDSYRSKLSDAEKNLRQLREDFRERLKKEPPLPGTLNHLPKILQISKTLEKLADLEQITASLRLLPKKSIQEKGWVEVYSYLIRQWGGVRRELLRGSRSAEQQALLIDYDEGRIAEQMSQLGKRLLSIPQLYQNDREKKAVEGLIHRVVNSV